MVAATSGHGFATALGQLGRGTVSTLMRTGRPAVAPLMLDGVIGSPDLYASEQGSPKLRAHISKAAPRSREDLWQCTRSIVQSAPISRRMLMDS
jgi:hypothetical protein